MRVRRRMMPPFEGEPWIRRHILEHYPGLQHRDALATLVAKGKVALRVSRDGQTIAFALLVPRDGLTADERSFVTEWFAERACFTHAAPQRPPREAIAASRRVERQLKMHDAVRSVGLEVTADGYQPPSAATPQLNLIALLFIVLVVGGGWYAIPPSYRPVAGVVLLLIAAAMVKSIIDHRRALRARPTALAMPDSASDEVAQRLNPADYPMKHTGTTDAIRWEATASYVARRLSSEERYYNDGRTDYEITEYTVWTTNQAAISGMLQFWPRWSQQPVSGVPFDIDNISKPSWTRQFLSHAGFSDSPPIVARLPIADETLLRHYNVLATADMRAEDISEQLKNTLIEVATAPIRGRALSALDVILYWRRGMIIHSGNAAERAEELDTIADIGVRCALASGR